MAGSSHAKALSRLKAAEEAKRNAAYDPAARWRHIQQTIAWAEASLPPAKRRNRPRFSHKRFSDSAALRSE